MPPFLSTTGNTNQRSAWLALLMMCAMLVGAALATPPVYDHVVIVIEENEDYADIIGSFSAPYINSLATGGISMTRMRGVTHPSEPNYHVLFSGDTQGAVDDSTPVAIPFTTPNLGAALLAAGRTFVGYADGLPAAGNITSDGVNSYVRYHCPWVWWMTNTPTSSNQLPPALHQPFTAFPSNFNQLPTVAFVIPNNSHNMHDFGVSSGDSWLSQNLSNYATWAKTHNSLLIVTWDESNFTQPNVTPTILYGANINHGQSDGSWTLCNLLRTLEDMYGLPHSGQAALVPPVTGVFASEMPVLTRYVQNGRAGYTGMHKTMLSSANPTTTYGSNNQLTVQAPGFQSLIRFDNLFGTGTEPVPPTVNIVSAKLVLNTNSSAGSQSYAPVRAYRMLVPWSESSTWDGMAGGISTDDVEAASVADFAAVPNYSFTTVTFDATASVRAWQGGLPNNGWTLQTASTDSWLWGGASPVLEISYIDGSIIGFTQNSAAVDENAGSVDLRVSRSIVAGTGSGTVSVQYSASDITAIEPSDYVLNNGTLTWDAGDTSDRFIHVLIYANSPVEGNETFQVTLSNPTTGSVLSANSTTVVTITEPPFNNWIVTHFGISGANAGPAAELADPDGDGVPNLLEYAFNSNPLTADTALPTVGGTDYLILTFQRNLAATELTYTVEASSDLATWSPGSTYAASGDTPSNEVTTQVSRTPNGATETIIVRDNIPTAGGGPRYLRLRVTHGTAPAGLLAAPQPAARLVPAPAPKLAPRVHFRRK